MLLMATVNISIAIYCAWKIMTSQRIGTMEGCGSFLLSGVAEVHVPGGFLVSLEVIDLLGHHNVTFQPPHLCFGILEATGSDRNPSNL